MSARTLTIFAGLFGALFVIATALRRRFAAQRKKRWGSKPSNQLAGIRCVACRKNIVAERDAVHCSEPGCSAPVHNDCLTRHTLSEHSPESRVYR